MRDRRKTPNPFLGESGFKRVAWADGYKCGHNDGEMDEREAGDQVRKEEIRLRGMVMDKSAEVRTLEHDAKFLRATIKNLQAKNRVANDTIGMLRDAPTFDEGNEEGYADGLAEGKRRLEGLGEVGYDAGYIKGREAGKEEGRDLACNHMVSPISTYRNARRDGYLEADRDVEATRKEGFEAGRKYGLQDWMMHFILYMQESGESFAVCQLSDLEDMREAVRELQSKRNNLEDGTAVFEEHLADIEAVLTKLEVVDR